MVDFADPDGSVRFGLTLKAFFQQANWGNLSAPRKPANLSPTKREPTEPIGGWSLNRFWSAGNWRNLAAAPTPDLEADAGADFQVDQVMSAFEWD